jgi:hypothetical protein
VSDFVPFERLAAWLTAFEGGRQPLISIGQMAVPVGGWDHAKEMSVRRSAANTPRRLARRGCFGPALVVRVADRAWGWLAA